MSHQVNAGSSILTRMRLTLIDLSLTVVPLITRHAITGESSHVAPTGGTIEARFVLTVVKLGLTVTACVICGTFAVVRVASIDTVSTMVAKLICLESSLSGCNFTRHTWDVTITT